VEDAFLLRYFKFDINYACSCLKKSISVLIRLMDGTRYHADPATQPSGAWPKTAGDVVRILYSELVNFFVKVRDPIVLSPSTYLLSRSQDTRRQRSLEDDNNIDI
jgi:hypothetical protein